MPTHFYTDLSVLMFFGTKVKKCQSFHLSRKVFPQGKNGDPLRRSVSKNFIEETLFNKLYYDFILILHLS